MKVLVVCSGNSENISPFVVEQVDSLRKLGIQMDYFLIQGKGYLGYLSNLPKLLKEIRRLNPQVIHAHYGYSGLLSCMQNQVPVVCTFHGSDIHFLRNRIFSFLVSRLTKQNIFVNKSQPIQLKYNKDINLIPCGVDLDVFQPVSNKYEIKKKLQIDPRKKIILFSSSFDNAIKNFSLAKESISLMGKNVELKEMKNFSRSEVNLWMNACDALLVTSHYESGPLVVKEAMASNCPIVSVDVGNVRELIQDVSYCETVERDSHKIAFALKKIIDCDKRTNGRLKLKKLKVGIDEVATVIFDIYQKMTRNGKNSGHRNQTTF